MIFFGHLGIGSMMTRPFRRPEMWTAILLGTLLPDLIDKPLYYGLSLATGLRGTDLGLICGSRTLGHTLIFTGSVAAFALWRKSSCALGLAMGALTHLTLDALFDPSPGYLLWPLTSFPAIPFKNLHEHLGSWKNLRLIGAEVAGAMLLAWESRDYFRRRKKRSSA